MVVWIIAGSVAGLMVGGCIIAYACLVAAGRADRRQEEHMRWVRKNVDSRLGGDDPPWKQEQREAGLRDD